MKNYPLSLAFLILFTSVFAQQYSTEFGKIAKDEYMLTTYDKDPEAEAVILFDVGESFFEYSYEDGFNIVFTHTKRIKILNDAGLDFADITIPYYVDGYGRTEKIREIVAYVYNLNDGYQPSRTELQQSSIYDEQLNKYYRAKKFALPDVKAGSIIEYKYVLWTPFHFNLPDWEFQDRIPTIYSKYTVKMIPFYEYVYLLQGGQLDEQNSYVETGLDRHYMGIKYQDYVHTFVKKDVPAFKDESYISTRGDYIAKIDFQLAKVRQPSGGTTEILTTWPNMIKELLDHEDFGKYINQAEKFAEKELLPSLQLDGLSDVEKCKSIVEKIKSDYTWNKYYAKIASQKFKSFLNTKQGNAADINLLAIGALRAAGIKADPLILSTRDHGKISSNHPFNHFFNYVIAIIDLNETLLLTDATEPLLSFDRIPPYCINDFGLVVKKAEEETWINLHNIGSGSQAYSVSLTPNGQDLTAKCMITHQSRDYSAYHIKNKYADDLEKIKEQYDKGDVLSIEKIQSKNFDKLHLPYLLVYLGDLSLESLQGKMVIKPFLNLPISKNPFTQKDRTYPIDFIYKQRNDFACNIIIPAGYAIDFLPSELVVNDDLMEFSYKLAITENSISIQAYYSLKKAVIEPGEYQTIKKHFDTLVQKLNEAIVLKASL